MIFNSYLVLSFLFTGCSATYQSVYPEPVNIKSIIAPGESVRVTTKDGLVHEIVVAEITDDALIGESNKFLFTDIDKLQEMTVTSGENTSRALITTGAIIVIMGAAGAEAAAGASPNW